MPPRYFEYAILPKMPAVFSEEGMPDVNEKIEVKVYDIEQLLGKIADLLYEGTNRLEVDRVRPTVVLVNRPVSEFLRFYVGAGEGLGPFKLNSNGRVRGRIGLANGHPMYAVDSLGIDDLLKVY